jgi:hypothetical protein
MGMLIAGFHHRSTKHLNEGCGYFPGCRWVDPAEPFDQPRMVHGSELIASDFSLLASKLAPHAGWVSAEGGGHRRDQRGPKVAMHFVG